MDFSKDGFSKIQTSHDLFRTLEAVLLLTIQWILSNIFQITNELHVAKYPKLVQQDIFVG